MTIAIFIIVILLNGCADKEQGKPFECSCKCKDSSFTCKGQSADIQKGAIKDGLKKYISK